MKFLDVNDKPVNTLPAESVTYNGHCLDEVIPGFRTLSVSGREMLAPEVKKSENVFDGDTYRRKRYPSRTITVTYQILSDSPETFRQAFNRLNGILDTEPIQVIFADEPDKYFTGVKTEHTDPQAGVNNCTGSFKIYCPDPFKYSLAERDFTAKDGVLTITNDGTVAVPIRYEITNGTHDNGYIGIVSDLGVMEFGKIEEADGQSFSRSEKLLSIDDFKKAPDDKTTPDPMHPSYGHAGSLKMGEYYSSHFLTLGEVGTEYGQCSGGMRTLTLPADSNKVVGAKNFYCWSKLVMYAALEGQTGEITLSFLTADNKLICGCTWYKTDCSGNTGNYQMIVAGTPDPKSDVAGRIIRNYSYKTSMWTSQNPWWLTDGYWDLKKEGADVTFFWWGSYYKFHIPEIENMECAKVQIACRAYRGRVGDQQLSAFGFEQIDFYKTNVSGWKDIPNRFPANARCVADGEKSKFFVNNMPRQQDEILGTTYFKAPPGATDIKLNFSSFCNPKPTVKAYIREAWI